MTTKRDSRGQTQSPLITLIRRVYASHAVRFETQASPPAAASTHVRCNIIRRSDGAVVATATGPDEPRALFEAMYPGEAYDPNSVPLRPSANEAWMSAWSNTQPAS